MKRALAQLSPLLAVLLAGCSTVAYNGSRIVTTPPGVKAAARGPTASLQLEQLRVALYAGDTVRGGQPPVPLRVLLVFEPREIGYSFDPGEVLLRDPGGTEWRTHAGPPGRYASREGCVPVAGGPAPGSDSPYHFLAPHTCFELGFDFTVPEAGKVELELAGLARGRRRLEPVRLLLERRSWRSLDRIYWLEAIGALLSAPM